MKRNQYFIFTLSEIGQLNLRLVRNLVLDVVQKGGPHRVHHDVVAFRRRYDITVVLPPAGSGFFEQVAFEQVDVRLFLGRDEKNLINHILFTNFI